MSEKSKLAVVMNLCYLNKVRCQISISGLPSAFLIDLDSRSPGRKANSQLAVAFNFGLGSNCLLK